MLEQQLDFIITVVVDNVVVVVVIVVVVVDYWLGQTQVDTSSFRYINDWSAT